MLRATLRAAALAAALLAAAPAAAQLSHTLQAANVRAGPNVVFPVLTFLPRNEPVRIVGCTEKPRWCDIVAGRTRGWMHGQYLADTARNASIPTVTFDLPAYWDAHYRGRPFAADHAQWMSWNTPGFVPPPVPPSRLLLRSPRGS